METELKASLFDIHPLSTHDGPGLRTAFFFKGCPLSCEWCQNPESIEMRDQVWHYPQLCLGCETCIETCEDDAVSKDDEQGILIDYELCTGCGACVVTCPGKAMKKTGEIYTLEDIMKIVERDSPFMNKKIGGGITVTGGEPLLYANFVEALFRRCREMSVHTALDTCGQASWKAFERVLPYTDLFLYDIKLIDNASHKSLTGKDNHTILGNATNLSFAIREKGYDAHIWIRTPLIPGATLTKKNIEEIGKFLNHEMSGTVERWELCAFNPLPEEKYDRLNINWKYKGVPLLTKAESETALRWAQDIFHQPGSVVLTGLISGD